MSVDGIDKATMEKMQEILKKPWHKHGKTTLFNEGIEVLREAKLAWDVKYINPSAMFVHEKNRAGLGLSPHNAHRNGARIHCGGLRHAASPDLVRPGLARGHEQRC